MYRLSFDKNELQLDVIHGFLKTAYWSEDVPKATVEKAIQGSFCVGCFDPNGAQVGFARIITDQATFAYLADVFVLPDHRGQGLAAKLVRGLMDHKDMQGLRRWLLATADAHGVYEKLGFKAVENPELFMEINVPNIYQLEPET